MSPSAFDRDRKWKELIEAVTTRLGEWAAAPDAPPPAGVAPLAPARATALDDAELAPWIDHTLLRADAVGADVDRLCDEARHFSFAAVCVNPLHVTRCHERLAGSGVRVATVAGFPLGATPPEIKAHEAAESVARGADEIDMVMNLGALREGDWRSVREDVAAVVAAVAHAAAVKVIIESGALSDEAIVAACLLSRSAGAAFVKTATGMLFGDAEARQVALMRRTVGPAMGVKAAGGIRDAAGARAMLAAGATRLGTSSAVMIVGA